MPKFPSLVERNMFDFFASPRLTLLRAQRHIHDFNAEVTHFISNKPWSYVTEKNVDGTLDLHKIKFARRLPSDLPCILFDAANNLRAVLDQAGYGSATAAGKIEPKNAYFPFGDDEPGLRNVIGRGRCKDLPPEILTLFCAQKPYKGGNDLLWALNRLCNTKKHCALVPLNIGAGILATEGDGTRLVLTKTMSVSSPNWDADKFELTLAESESKANVRYSADVAFSVAIEGIEIVQGKPAIEVLNGMLREVDRVLEATEGECRRIGLIK